MSASSTVGINLVLDHYRDSSERIARWRDVMELSGKVHVPDEEAFTGTLASRSFGDLRTMHISARTFRLERDRVMARGMRRDYVFVNLVESGSVVGKVSPRQVRLDAGDMMISRMASPMDLLIEDATWLALIIPRGLFEKHLPWSASHDARVFGAGTVEAVMLTGLLRSLAVLPAALSARQTTCAVRSSLALITACLGQPPAASKPDEVEADPARSIRRFIADRLTDPSLGPDLICREFQISRSRLYRIMGESADIAAIIRRLRLQAVHRDITSPQCTTMSLATIGGRWGLLDERTLRRAFLQEFGYSPSTLRKQGNGIGSSGAFDLGTIGFDLERWFLGL